MRMLRWLTKLERSLLPAEGASAIEYAILAGFIALVIVVGLTAIGTNLVRPFDAISTVLP